MTYEEFLIAMTNGWTVYYKDKSNVVVTGEFPYSDYAVKWANGALGYICPWGGVESDLFTD